MEDKYKLLWDAKGFDWPNSVKDNPTVHHLLVRICNLGARASRLGRSVRDGSLGASVTFRRENGIWTPQIGMVAKYLTDVSPFYATFHDWEREPFGATMYLSQRTARDIVKSPSRNGLRFFNASISASLLNTFQGDLAELHTRLAPDNLVGDQASEEDMLNYTGYYFGFSRNKVAQASEEELAMYSWVVDIIEQTVTAVEKKAGI